MKGKNLLRKLMVLGLTGAMATSLLACGADSESSSEVADVDFNSLSLEEIIAGAKEEGNVYSVGMPDTWANWIETWEEINTEYGIAHEDLDMSSSEEIAMFKEEGTDATKDIGDVGLQWGSVAEEEGVTLKYKTSYWDSIPDWAKDDDGDYVAEYTGTMCLLTNDTLVENAPTSWADVLEGDYKVSIGDVAAASQAQHAVLATAYAMGGGLDDIQPALDFWKEIAEQGRLDVGECSLARIESGEIAVGCFWDYNALNYRDQAVANNSSLSFTVNIPSDGSVTSAYCSIINVNAPDPYAACLTREYILSDEGQINLAKGYATPIRSDVELPEEVQAMRIDESQYASAVPVEDFETWAEKSQEIIEFWEEEIVPLLN